MVVRLCFISVIAVLGSCGGSSRSSNTDHPLRSPGTTYSGNGALGMDPSDPSYSSYSSDSSGPSGPAAPRQPIDISVEGTRVGNSVRLDIMGVGKRRPAEHVMEKAENWTVQALFGEDQLDRVVNGSVKVARDSVGNPRYDMWDIEVRFSVAFTIPEAAERITVRITAPETPMYEHELAVGPVPPTPESVKADAPKPKTKTNTKTKKPSRKRSKAGKSK